MNELEKIIHRLHLVSDAEAPEFVAEFFNELSQNLENAELADYVQKEAEYIRNIVPCWESLQTSLAEVLCEPFPEDDYFQDLLISLYELAENKIHYLNDLNTIILPEAKPFSYAFTNINFNQMGTVLRGIAQRAGTQLNLPKKLTQAEVLSAIKDIAKVILAQEPFFPDSSLYRLSLELEAFAGAVKQYFAKKNIGRRYRKKATEFSHDFVYCMKCWRLVPKEHFGDGAPPLCDLHNYLSEEPGCFTDYKKALQINIFLMEHHMQMSKMEMEIFARFKKVWPSYAHDDLTREEWDLAFEVENGFKKLLDKSPKLVEYAMEPIWGVCPQTCAYILANGGDPLNCESVLEILDPFTEYEIRVGDTEPREYLHKALCLNFSYYRLELAKAEAWLSTYNKLYGGKTHGGPRKNSGGKRPGAGRPKKKP